MRPLSWKVLFPAFVAIWAPYVASVGLQERFRVSGPFGPALMALSLLMAGAIAVFLSRISGRSPFGLRVNRWTLPVTICGIAAMAAARLLAADVATTLGIATYDGASGPLDVAGPFAIALVIGAVPALAEDILTRGFPLFAVRSTYPTWLLIVASAAMYTFNHVWRFDFGISEQVRLFCMGIAYALAARRSGTLWAAFGLHLGWNAASALSPLDITGTDAFRYETAVIHLVIAAMILLLPKFHQDR